LTAPFAVPAGQVFLQRDSGSHAHSPARQRGGARFDNGAYNLVSHDNGCVIGLAIGLRITAADSARLDPQ